MNISRRELVATAGATGVLGMAATAQLWRKVRHLEPYTPRLERINLAVPPGHEHLAGLTIGFVADCHVGPFFTTDDLKRATDLLVAERPDLVLLGGDYISESTRFAWSAAAVLGELARNAPLGGFAVMGNHDLSGHERGITAALNDQDIPILRNDVTCIPYGGGTLWLAGVDETLLGSPDPDATFAQIPAGAASLCLWHEGDYAAQAARRGAFAQLSGHTHGGQLRFPILGPLVLPPDGRRYIKGRYAIEDMTLYVSRGVGVYRPPLRLRCPPEVTLVTLTATVDQ